MPMVSVIMPVYKVEKFVGRCIDSLLNQTLTDFEFFAVDDGSPDRSGEICDAYALKDTRIRVIHKVNGGAASARNTAMELATGKYLYFLDSDDWAEPTMLEDMVNLAEANASQLVVSGYFIDTYDGDTKIHVQDKKCEDAVYQSAETFRRAAYKLFDENLLYTPWNKLYLREYVMEHNIRFPQTYWDDFPFNLMVIRDIERVSVTSKQYYHFLRARQESETAMYRPDLYEKREEENRWLKGLYRYWHVADQASCEMLARRYIERLVGCIENVMNQSCTLSGVEKSDLIRTMLNNPEVSKALKKARPRSIAMKGALLPIRWKSVPLSKIMGSSISFVKRHNTKLFSTVKANR